MAVYNFNKSGVYVTFTDNGGGFIRMHESRRLVEWSVDECGDLIFYVRNKNYHVKAGSLSQVAFDGVAIDSVDDFGTQVAVMFTGYSSSPGGASYLVYVINMTQDLAANNPTVTEHENTIEFGAWTRDGVGSYMATVQTSVFDFSKWWFNGVLFNSSFVSEKIPINQFGSTAHGYYKITVFDNGDGTTSLVLNTEDESDVPIDIADLDYPLIKFPEVRLYP
jgi:hypothetical protein